MNANLLAPSTVLATFTAADADGLPLRIEVRPRMGGLGYTVAGFDAYCGDNSTGIGADSAMEAIGGAIDSADAMKWENFTLTDDGEDALAREAVATYCDQFDSPDDADLDGLLAVEGNNWNYWQSMGVKSWNGFERALRNAFFTA